MNIYWTHWAASKKTGLYSCSVWVKVILETNGHKPERLSKKCCGHLSIDAAMLTTRHHLYLLGLPVYFL